MAVFAAGFPESPDPGDTHTNNGVLYKWNGSAWDIVSSPGGGGGGSDGVCPDACLEYTDELVKDEAEQRAKGDDILEQDIESEKTARKESEQEIKGLIDDHDARIGVLESLDIDGGGEIELKDYATKNALKAEEDARIAGDNELREDVDKNKDTIAEEIDKLSDTYAGKTHNHSSQYAALNHAHDDIQVDVDLTPYAKGEKIVFSWRANNLYVKWEG